MESRVRPNVYAVCPIACPTGDEQRCRDIADEFLVRLGWRIFGPASEILIPAAFTLEWSGQNGILHALVRCTDHMSISDFSRILVDEWQGGGWGPDLTVNLRDAGCVRKAVAHGLDTFLITT